MLANKSSRGEPIVAKFFVPLLHPFATNSLTITDTFSFVKEILNLPFNTTSKGWFCYGLPSWTIFLDNLFSPKPLVHSCSKKILFFCIPYTGQHGLQIHTQLNKLLSKAYPHISIRFVFRPACRLSDFFPFKDRIPSAMRSHVVYKYKCQCCGALYVGQTRRHIHTRTLNIWEFRPKLEISFQSHRCLLFLLTIISPNIPFLTLTLLY